MDIHEKLLAFFNENEKIIKEDAPTDVLLDLIGEILQYQNKKIKSLSAENAHERLVIKAEYDRLKSERKEMARNPLYGATGEFCFVGADSLKIRLTVRSGIVVDAIQRTKKADYALMQLSPDLWYKTKDK